MTDETIIPITALELDPRNARKRTPRSSKVIGESLQEFGPLRSLVGQRLPDGRIVVRAGNGTLEEAGQIGIDKVRIVERRSDELVVVVADDLDETQWTRYAIADNRASDLSTWDAEVLEILDQEIDLEPFFLGDELNALMAGLAGDGEGLVGDPNEILGESANQPDPMAENSLPGIIIEFQPEDYKKVLPLIKDLRNHGVYVGGLVLEALEYAND